MNELSRIDFNVSEISPSSLDLELSNRTFYKVTLSDIVSTGAGLDMIVTSISQFFSQINGSSGYYKVTIPHGTYLASFKDGSGFLGTALNGNGIAAQARITPIAFNPTTLFVASSLYSINKKLDDIKTIQTDIINHMIQKEKSSLKGNLDLLLDIYDNYKFNWNDDKYKTANHLKALDVRQSSYRSIDYYKELIKKAVSKKSFLHSNRDVIKTVNKLVDTFNDYRLSVYIYGFSYFLEILLQENYNDEYLKSVISNLESISFEYRELYSNIYEIIDNLSKTSIQSKLIKNISTFNKIAGDTIAKIPIISNSNINENLIETGDKLADFTNRYSDKLLTSFRNARHNHIRPFIDNINTLNKTFNHSLEIIFDKDELFLISTDGVD